MTDFYSVLKSSIIKRDLRSAAARHEVYDQAREAMIRRLWSLDPPLSEEEIDTRIGAFDAAVERIEDDLERSFAAAERINRQRSQPRNLRPPPPPRPTQPPLVYEGYDEDADYAPVSGQRTVPNRTDMQQPSIRDRNGEAQRNRRQVAQETASRGMRRERHDKPAVAARRQARPDDHRDSPPRPRDSGLGESRPQAYSGESAYSHGALARRDYNGETYREPAYDEDLAGDEFEDNSRNQPPTVIEVAAADTTYRDIAHDNDGYRESGYRDGPYRRPRYEEAAYYDYDDQETDDPYYDAPPQRSGGLYDARRLPDDPPADDPYVFPADDRYVDDFEPTRNRPEARRRQSGKRPRGKAGKPSRYGGGRTVPILAVAIGALALILLAFNAYVFLPILFSSAPSRSAPVASPQKVEDRLPALNMPSEAPARIVSDSAAAIEIPERNLDVTESLVIFNGSDPTVFEGTSNNPIQFDSDSEGGFARISSAASAAGARAIIGPGLADRLAGHTIRVTVLARSSPEDGAAKMRFAYQSGLAVSHWQSADLSPHYGTYGMIWRVPAADNAAGDYLIIEPGIPGDGTSTDIRMIKIDIVAS